MNREEAEAFVLGSMLFNENYINGFPINPSNFHTKRYKIIYTAMLDINKHGAENAKGANFIYTLINYLKMKDLLEEVGAEPEIVGLQMFLPDKNTPADMARAINLLKNAPNEITFITNR
jgi:replicative DNA helicase